MRRRAMPHQTRPRRCRIDAAASLHPYRDRFDRYDRMPPKGRDRADILDEMRAMRADEESRWADGFASGSVYHGDPDHIAFLNEAYAINSQANPLHADLWPSVVKFEAEIVAMTADMVGGGPDGVDTVCGSVSSGGTDSILLAMKVYRDRGRLNGITQPNLVVATSAHAAFEKACQYFAMELRKVPVAADGRADVEAMIAAVDDSTIALVGSAPCFPTGLIDPIEELAAAAAARGIGFHTDCCLGGFLLPWAERLGYPVPPFDFRVPGVTSISCDTHKYGYAAKGTSVVLYRTPELRHLQYYTTASWAGGLYYSPTFAGSRPGALSAACWAAMVSLGEEGYLDAGVADPRDGRRGEGGRGVDRRPRGRRRPAVERRDPIDRPGGEHLRGARADGSSSLEPERAVGPTVAAPVHDPAPHRGRRGRALPGRPRGECRRGALRPGPGRRADPGVRVGVDGRDPGPGGREACSATSTASTRCSSDGWRGA